MQTSTMLSIVALAHSSNEKFPMKHTPQSENLKFLRGPDERLRIGEVSFPERCKGVADLALAF
jgi:hypothetical protein